MFEVSAEQCGGAVGMEAKDHLLAHLEHCQLQQKCNNLYMFSRDLSARTTTSALHETIYVK